MEVTQFQLLTGKVGDNTKLDLEGRSLLEKA